MVLSSATAILAAAFVGGSLVVCRAVTVDAVAQKDWRRSSSVEEALPKIASGHRSADVIWARRHWTRRLENPSSREGGAADAVSDQEGAMGTSATPPPVFLDHARLYVTVVDRAKGSMFSPHASALVAKVIESESQRSSSNFTNVTVLGVSSVCWECDPQWLGQNTTGNTVTVDVPTDHAMHLVVVAATTSSSDTTATIAFDYWFGDRGEYEVQVVCGSSASSSTTTTTPMACSGVDVAVVSEPYSTALPVIVAAIILLAINFAIRGGWMLYDRYQLARQRATQDALQGSFLSMVTNSARMTAGVGFAGASPAGGSGTNSGTLPAQSRSSTPAAPLLRVAAAAGSSSSKHPPPPSRPRLVSLDTFRGISLAIMIFVNSNGGYYWWLTHSFWNGVTIADLVFPWFIFMMGVSMAIVLRAEARRRTPSVVVMLRAVKRGAILFALGLFDAAQNDETANEGRGGTNFAILRIPGVLQRFGVGFVVVAAIAYLLPPFERCRDDDDDLATGQRRVDGAVTAPSGTASHVNVDVGAGRRDDEPPSSASEFGDEATWKQSSVWKGVLTTTFELREYWLQWISVALLQLVWFLVTFFMPFPGCPTGYLGPGGIGNHGRYQNCTGGVATYIDRAVFGETHLFKWFAGAHATYKTTVYHDPEGLLGYLNSIALVYLGLHAGRVMLRYAQRGHRAIIVRLLSHGAFLCLLGGILCRFSQNDGWVPVNKNLWSPSFVYVLGGFAMWSLAALHYVVDVRKWWDGAPFSFLGMNSIVIYMGSELFSMRFPFSFAPPATTHSWELFANLLSVCCWLLIAYALHVKKLYFSV